MDVIAPKDRRAITRRNLGNSIKPVRLYLAEGEIVARVQDISIAGIGILTHQRLELGTWLVLEPAEPRESLSPELRVEVRHTRKSDKEEEAYLVGCRFSRLLTSNDVMALG